MNLKNFVFLTFLCLLQGKKAYSGKLPNDEHNEVLNIVNKPAQEFDENISEDEEDLWDKKFALEDEVNDLLAMLNAVEKNTSRTEKLLNRLDLIMKDVHRNLTSLEQAEPKDETEITRVKGKLSELLTAYNRNKLVLKRNEEKVKKLESEIDEKEKILSNVDKKLEQFDDKANKENKNERKQTKKDNELNGNKYSEKNSTNDMINKWHKMWLELIKENLPGFMELLISIRDQTHNIQKVTQINSDIIKSHSKDLQYLLETNGDKNHKFHKSHINKPFKKDYSGYYFQNTNY